MKIGDILTETNYTEAALWCQNKNATIQKNDQGQYQIVSLSVEAEKPYIAQRLEAYPNFAQQLDMIYWDKVNGTNLWQEKIAEIKAKYPKE